MPIGDIAPQQIASLFDHLVGASESETLCQLDSITFILEDVETGVGVSEIHPRISIDKHITRLYHFHTVWSGIDQLLGRRRYKIAYFLRRKWILNVEYPEARIVIGGEDQIAALK